jgi:hypothetical protein
MTEPIRTAATPACPGAAGQATCGAAAFLRRGGPVQVPFRPCCVAALLHAAQTSDAAFAGDSLFALTPSEVIA